MIWLTTSHAGESQTKGCMKCQGPLPSAITFKSFTDFSALCLDPVCTIEATFLCESDTFDLRHSREMAVGLRVLSECLHLKQAYRLVSSLKAPGPKFKLHNPSYGQKQHLDGAFHSLYQSKPTAGPMCWTCVLKLS